MYKCFTISLALMIPFVFCQTGTAQTKTKGKVSNAFFDVAFGKKLNLDKEFRAQTILARPQGGYLVQSFGKGEKEMGVDIVGSNFEQSASRVNTRNGSHRSNEKLLYFAGMPIWVNSNYDSDSKEEKIFLQEISDETGEFAKDEILIHKTRDVSGGLHAEMRFMSIVIVDTDKYFCSISPDSSKLLVYYRKKPAKRLDKLNKDIWGFVVVDQTFKTLWSKELEMPKTEFMMRFYEAEVNNEGTVYFLAKVYKDERRKYKKGEKPNYTLSVFELGKESKKAKERPIDMGESFLGASSFFISDAGEVVICGTHSKRYKGNGASGVFYNIVDMTERKTRDTQFLDFESDLDADYEGPKHAKRLEKIYKKYGEGYIPYLQFREVFFDAKDKSLYMILESYHMVARSSNNGRTTTYYYYYDDVYALKVNTTKQQIEKAYKVPKKQLGINIDVDLSISGFLFDEEMYIFFIDNKKNLELRPDMVPAEHRSTAGGFLSGVRIDFSTDNGPERFLLYDAKVEKKYCDPSRFVSSDNAIYGIGYEKPKGGGPYYPIRISFK